MVNLTVNFCGVSNQGVGCLVPDDGGFLSDPIMKLAIYISSGFLLLLILIFVFTRCLLSHNSKNNKNDHKKRMDLIKIYQAK